MTNSNSEASHETSEASASSSRSRCFLKPWRRWWPGPYCFVFIVNATATALLFPGDFHEDDVDWDRLWDRVTEETRTTYNITKADLNLLPCPVHGRVIFSGLQLASFGAGCAAAFLQKKAQASAHARLTFSYASINWLQSLLASTRARIRAANMAF